jgi:hypothetical protein
MADSNGEPVMTNKERIRKAIEHRPDASDAHIAEILGVHRKTVWSVRKAMQGPAPAKIDVVPHGQRWYVTLNDRLWHAFRTKDMADAEADWLRWPKKALDA